MKKFGNKMCLYMGHGSKSNSNSFPSLLPIFGKFGKTPPQRAYMRAGYDFASRFYTRRRPSSRAREGLRQATVFHTRSRVVQERPRRRSTRSQVAVQGIPRRQRSTSSTEAAPRVAVWTTHPIRFCRAGRVQIGFSVAAWCFAWLLRWWPRRPYQIAKVDRLMNAATEIATHMGTCMVVLILYSAECYLETEIATATLQVW